jgi:hypothetical protein
MSGSTPGAGRIPRRFIAGALCAGSLVALAGFGTPAQAAFTTGKCLGDGFLIGRGASFAASSHRDVWIPSMSTFCQDVGTTPVLTYDSTGSGSGRRVMGERTNGSPEGDNRAGALSRTQVPRFGMTEEPPSEQGQTEINQGTDAVGDEGQMRLIPAAMGAVAVAVNLPDGCDPFTNPDGSVLTGAVADRFSNYSATENNQRRLRLTRQQLERIYAGDSSFDQWGEIIPNINDGNGTASQAADTRCQQWPIIRIRRLDDGGTTFAFKDYLDKLNPSFGWKSTYVSSPDTRNWPNATKTVEWDYSGDGDTTDAIGSTLAYPGPCASATPNPTTGAQSQTLGCNESAVPTLQTTEVAPSAGNGNDNLIDKVNDFDGSIGYGDLSTARQQRSFSFERQSGADDRYWVQIQTKCGGAGNCAQPTTQSYADPQSAPTGYRTGGARGVNCTTAALSNLPGGNDPTLANWADVTAADSSQIGYGACSLTYFIVFDDYAGVYPGDQAAEERKARSVRDYVEHTVDFTGQVGLGAFDYGTLPPSVSALAVNAAQQIGWNKGTGTGGGGGGAGEQPVTPPSGGGATPTQPGGTTTPPVTGQQAPPSNAFTIPSRRLNKGNIVLSLQVPGAGSVRATATARYRGKTIQVGSSASTVRSGGRVSLTLKPSKATVAALKKASLKVTIQVTYQPSGGQANTQRASLTLKKAKAKKKASKKRT